MNRRSFLKLLGVAGAAVVVPELVVEPRRRIWQVSRAAPVDVGAAMRAYAIRDAIPIRHLNDPWSGPMRRQLMTDPPVTQMSLDGGHTWINERTIGPETFKASIPVRIVDDFDDNPDFAATLDKFREVMNSTIDDASLERIVFAEPPRPPRKRQVFRAEIKIDGLDLHQLNTLNRRFG